MAPSHRFRLAALSLAILTLSCIPDATAPSHPGPIVLSVVSGSGQSSAVGTELAQPLVIRAADSAGSPISDVTVNYVVTSGGGSVYAEAVSTDASGLAADYWTLGTSTTQAQRLEVRSVSSSGVKQVFGVFTATAVPGPATGIAILAGNNQQAQAGTAVPIRPAVTVTDQYGNRTPGVSVTYTIYQGGGSASPNPAVSDSTGVATTSWTLGPAPGSNTMSATITGTSRGVTFVATGTACDCWSQVAPMPTKRFGLAVGAINGTLYAVGGFDDRQYPGPLAANEAYDPVANAWTTRAPMPTPRHLLGVAVLGSLLYAVGGRDYYGAWSSALEVYDPAANSWTTLAPMPTGRAGLGVAVVNGLVYAVGGYLGVTPPLTVVEVYDPGTDTWTTKAPMLTARDGLGLAAINGKLYAVGGEQTSQSFLATLEIYDPTTDTWTAGPAMPTARAYAGVTALNGILYVIGGQNSSGALTTVEAFDPSTGAWSTKPSLPASREAPGAGAANQTLFALGGIVSSTASTTVEALLRP